MENKLDTLKIEDKGIENKNLVLYFKNFFQCFISNILGYTILRNDLPEEKIISENIPKIGDKLFNDFIQKEIRLVLINDEILLKNIKKLRFNKDLYKVKILIGSTKKDGYIYFNENKDSHYFHTLKDYKDFIKFQENENRYFNDIGNKELNLEFFN